MVLNWQIVMDLGRVEPYITSQLMDHSESNPLNRKNHTRRETKQIISILAFDIEMLSLAFSDTLDAS